MISTYVKDLRREFSGYNGTKLKNDIMAGITVAAVALPLALAFGVSSGASAAAGLVTAIIGGIIISIFSGASFQISGPTGAMTAILVTLVMKYGIQGVLLAGFMAGIVLVLAGLFRLGKIIYLIPSSVITGFTSGIAITIALGQLDNLFGVTSQGDLAINKFISYFTCGFHPDMVTTAIGIGTIIFMIIWPKKLNEKVPSSLAAIILAVILMYAVHPDVAVVGDIPKSLLLKDRLSWSAINLTSVRALISPALSIAALGMIESLLCGASAGKMKDEELNADRELVAQGIGNMLVPLLGGVPATAAIARSSVAIKAGSETRLTGIIHAIILFLSMMILSPIMSQIPLSALAGILVMTAWRMNDWANIKFIFSHKFKSGMAKFGVTMLATVVFDLTEAIVIGISLATIMILVRMTDIEVTVKPIKPEKLAAKGFVIPEVSENIRVAYLTGNIFFAVVDKLRKELQAGVEECPCRKAAREAGESVQTGFADQLLIISMRGVPVMDLSGVQAMIELIAAIQADGGKVFLTSVQPQVLEKMRRGGVLDMIGEEHVYSSAEHAIVAAHEEVA